MMFGNQTRDIRDKEEVSYNTRDRKRRDRMVLVGKDLSTGLDKPFIQFSTMQNNKPKSKHDAGKQANMIHTNMKQAKIKQAKIKQAKTKQGLSLPPS